MPAKNEEATDDRPNPYRKKAKYTSQDSISGIRIGKDTAVTHGSSAFGRGGSEEGDSVPGVFSGARAYGPPMLDY